MFFAVTQYGAQALTAAYDALPIPADKKLKLTAAFFGISEGIFKRYLSGQLDPPRAVCFALWHESHLGRYVVHMHSEHEARLWRSLAKSQESEISRMSAIIATLERDLSEAKRAAPGAALPANEPIYRVR
jgi:hypothetical protein